MNRFDIVRLQKEKKKEKRRTFLFSKRRGTEAELPNNARERPLSTMEPRAHSGTTAGLGVSTPNLLNNGSKPDSAPMMAAHAPAAESHESKSEESQKDPGGTYRGECKVRSRLHPLPFHLSLVGLLICYYTTGVRLQEVCVSPSHPDGILQDLWLQARKACQPGQRRLFLAALCVPAQ